MINLSEVAFKAVEMMGNDNNKYSQSMKQFRTPKNFTHRERESINVSAPLFLVTMYVIRSLDLLQC
jgi:hypothetical protein